MPAQVLVMHPRAAGGLLEDVGDRVSVETARRDLAMTVDGAKDRARFDFSFLEPELQGANGARRFVLAERDSNLAPGTFLVRLTAAEIADKTFRAGLQILYVEPGRFGSSKSTCEGNQKQRLVAKPEQVLRAGRNETADVGGKQRVFSVR